MMTMRRTIMIIVTALVVCPAAHGQIVVDAGMKTFTPPTSLFKNGPRLPTAADAELLIRQTLGSVDSYGQQVLNRLASKDFYAVIHVLKWADPTVDQAGKVTQTVQEQNWYMFRGGEGWMQTDFIARRLYGAKDFYLLAVHLNYSPDVTPYRLDYRITIAKRQPANIANLLAAAKLLGADFDVPKLSSVAEPRDLFAAQNVPVDDVPSDLTVAPAIMTLTAGTIAPVQVAGGVGGGANAGFVKPGAAPNAEKSGAKPTPAGDAAPAADDDQARQNEIAALRARLAALEQKAPDARGLGDVVKIDNEGKYWWDVSIGVPVRKVSDFQRTETGLDVKTVSKSTAFALVNIYLRPMDIKTPALNAIPHVLLGVGLEKKPLERFFIGGAWGPVYANFFAGVAFKRVDEEGKVTYPREVTFGLNVPLLAVTKRLAEQTK